jgi:hypothetical protein
MLKNQPVVKQNPLIKEIANPAKRDEINSIEYYPSVRIGMGIF